MWSLLPASSQPSLPLGAGASVVPCPASSLARSSGLLGGLTIVRGQEGGLVDIVSDVEGLAVQDGGRGDLAIGGVDVQPAGGVRQLRVPGGVREVRRGPVHGSQGGPGANLSPCPLGVPGP